MTEEGKEASQDPVRSLKHVERACVEHVLYDECDGRVLETAQKLGVAQKTVYNRLAIYRSSGIKRIPWPEWVVDAVSSPVVGVDTPLEIPGLSTLYGITPAGWVAGVTPRPLTEVPQSGHRVCFASVTGARDAVNHVFSGGQSLPWFFEKPDPAGIRVVLKPAPFISGTQVQAFDNWGLVTCCLFDVE
jgi:hypothetical protein